MDKSWIVRRGIPNSSRPSCWTYGRNNWRAKASSRFYSSRKFQILDTLISMPALLKACELWKINDKKRCIIKLMIKKSIRALHNHPPWKFKFFLIPPPILQRSTTKFLYLILESSQFPIFFVSCLFNIHSIDRQMLKLNCYLKITTGKKGHQLLQT